MKNLKKIIALVLVFILAFSALQITASAASAIVLMVLTPVLFSHLPNLVLLKKFLIFSFLGVDRA